MKNVWSRVFFIVRFHLVITMMSLMMNGCKTKSFIYEGNYMKLKSEVTQIEPLIIRSIYQLIRFRLLRSQRGVHLISAADSLPEPGEEASDDQERGIRWLVIDLENADQKASLRSNTWVQGQRVKDFDLWVEGDKCIWVIESNGLEGALRINEIPCIDISNSVPPFKEGQIFMADLPITLRDQIEVGVAWHTQLPPEMWLFNPRVRKDLQGKWLVSCNTLDGHLLELRGPMQKTLEKEQALLFNQERGQDWEKVRFLPQRLNPMTILCGDSKITAFLQASLSNNLFYSLLRYSGLPNQGDPSGILKVEIEGEKPVDLSNAMGLGLVHAFDMDMESTKHIMIAALHKKGSETKLTIFHSLDYARSWNFLVSIPLEGYADKVSLRTSGGGYLYVGYSLVEDDFSIIKVFTLPL